MRKRNNTGVLKKRILILLTGCAVHISLAQVPSPALIGYFHNWQDANAPYIQLDQIDSRYNIIDIAFAVPQPGTDYKLEFIPDQVSQVVFISQIQILQAQGHKVLISIGGATAPVSLDNAAERDTFVSSLTTIINTFGFDGIDIDLEGSSLSVTGGTIASPVDQPIINLIDGIKQVMSNYYQQHNHKLILTMAPETAYVQGGMSAYGGIWGAYLPVIHALRDSIDILHVQLYNSGSMYGIDGNIYTQGTADFIVAMCEAVIQGFNTTGGFFAGLPESKIAAGLPACIMAAGGGFADTNIVATAVHYLLGNGSQPGNYSLVNPAGYPALRGMMTWSINWDASSTCAGVYEYAQNFESIFGSITTAPFGVAHAENIFTLSPNPANEYVVIGNPFAVDDKIIVTDMSGRILFSKTFSAPTNHYQLATDSYANGIYFVEVTGNNFSVTKKLIVTK